MIRFFFEVPVKLLHRRLLKATISSLFAEEGYRLKLLNVIFCRDETLLAINKQHLSHNFYTDIVTFDLSDGEEISAELYISTDRVLDNAKNLKVPFSNELLRVIFHGALHLCGYKDKSKTSQKEMRLREDFYLNRFNVSRGT